ncbi:unnamed protein product [Gadus morhua 'NCC']
MTITPPPGLGWCSFQWSSKPPRLEDKAHQVSTPSPAMDPLAGWAGTQHRARPASSTQEEARQQPCCSLTGSPLPQHFGPPPGSTTLLLFHSLH